MGDEVDFLSADKHKNFLQVGNITFSVHIQECPKYPKPQVYNILSYLNENMKYEVDFLPADKRHRFLQSGTIILAVSGPAYQNYQK